MEHPSKLLLNPINTRQQQALFALVFETLPTSAEITSGTANYRWIFRLFSEDEGAEAVLVRLRGLNWNQIEETIMQWKELRIGLDLSSREIAQAA